MLPAGSGICGRIQCNKKRARRCRRTRSEFLISRELLAGRLGGVGSRSGRSSSGVSRSSSRSSGVGGRSSSGVSSRSSGGVSGRSSGVSRSSGVGRSGSGVSGRSSGGVSSRSSSGVGRGFGLLAGGQGEDAGGEEHDELVVHGKLPQRLTEKCEGGTDNASALSVPASAGGSLTLTGTAPDSTEARKSRRLSDGFLDFCCGIRRKGYSVGLLSWPACRCR